MCLFFSSPFSFLTKNISQLPMSVAIDNKNSEEIKRMRQLHGTIHLEESGFLKKITQKDKALNKDTTDFYYNNWKDADNLKDNNKHVEERRHEAQNMTNSFYDMVTDFYEYGWGQSFHFAKLYKGNFPETTFSL